MKKHKSKRATDRARPRVARPAPVETSNVAPAQHELYTYEIYPTAHFIADYLAVQLDTYQLHESARAVRVWAEEPDAMFAQAWFEAVGVKVS
jgi:hypothetical protein